MSDVYSRWIKAIAAIVVLICFLSIINNIEYRQQQRAAAWKESVQAIELEQEKIQNDIIRIREQLISAEEQLHTQNLLVWDIRSRLHLDLEADLEDSQ